MPFKCSCGKTFEDSKQYTDHLRSKEATDNPEEHEKIGWVDPESGEVFDRKPYGKQGAKKPSTGSSGNGGQGSGSSTNQGRRDNAPGIRARGRQWEITVSPWVHLHYDAAKEQIPELRDISLDDYIFMCSDFVKDILGLKPPGWVYDIRTIAEMPKGSPEWGSGDIQKGVSKLEEEIREQGGNGESESDTGSSGEGAGIDGWPAESA